MQLTLNKTISLGKKSTVVVIEKGVELLPFMIHLETAPVCCVGLIDSPKRFQVERQIIPCRGVAGIEVNYLLEMLYRFAGTFRMIVKYSKLKLRFSVVGIEFAGLEQQLLTLLGLTLHYQDLSSHSKRRGIFHILRNRRIGEFVGLLILTLIDQKACKVGQACRIVGHLFKISREQVTRLRGALRGFDSCLDKQDCRAVGMLGLEQR